MDESGGSSGDGDRRRPIFWAFAVAAALVSILFYRDFVFRPDRLIFGTDMLLEGIPLRQFYVDEIRAGRGVPLWTPDVYAGMPYVALLPGPIFYPTTLLYFVMPLFRAIGWTFVIHTFLSGLFGYFLARSFRLRVTSAVVCGASFMLSGYMTSHLYGGHDGRMFAMALIPLALGLLERGLSSGEGRWFAGLAIVVAMQSFTPHTQVMYFSCLALALYFLFHVVFRIPRGSSEAVGKRYLRPVGGFVLAFAGAVAISGPQLFPTLALLDDVTRAATERGYEFAASFALPPQEVTALFLPDLISSLPGRYWGQNPLKLHTEYMGAVPLALAFLGVAASFRQGLGTDKRRVIGFLGVASVLGILFALGSVTPVHRIAHGVVPMISSLRAPAMMLGPVSVFVALLAGFGWEAVLHERESSRSGPPPVSWVALALLAAPVLLLGLAAAMSPHGLLNYVALAWYPEGWPRMPDVSSLAPALRVNGLLLLTGFAATWGVARAVSRRRLAPLAVAGLLGFAIADLWRVDARYLETRGATVELGGDPVLATLAREAGPGDRVWAPDLAGPTRNYRPNRFTYFGVSSATGHQKFLLTPYARLVGGIQPDRGLLEFPSLIALLNVRFLITPGPQNGLETLAEAEGRYLYRIPAPPYAYFPAEVVVVDDTAEVLARTRANRDPLSVAFVEPVAGHEAPRAGRGSATISHYEPDRIVLDVNADEGGLLFLSEIHHSNWQAFVDGEEAPVWRVNVAFRGVVVPAGRHRLELAYRSPSYRLGVWASLLASLVAVGVVIYSLRSSRAGNVP